ncbi:MAG: hypothetical protein OCD00_19505 [Colwellia sp.]
MDVYDLVSLLAISFSFLGFGLIISCRKNDSSQSTELRSILMLFITGPLFFLNSRAIFTGFSINNWDYLPFAIGFLFIFVGIILLSRFIKKYLFVEKM